MHEVAGTQAAFRVRGFETTIHERNGITWRAFNNRQHWIAVKWLNHREGSSRHTAWR